MTPRQKSALYVGDVMHRRLAPIHHRFRYGIFSLYLDLDELEALDSGLKMFGYNRRAPLAFYDRDHGPGDGTRAKDWVADEVRKAGIGWRGGPIRLLCFPRMWGYVFNPLAVYYVFHEDERLAAVVYQVSNTFGERHSYLIPADDAEANGTLKQSCDKNFYVSPFFGLDYRYHFKLRVPDAKFLLAIRQQGAEGDALVAVHRGMRRDLTDSALVRAVAAHPLMTVKVMTAIHWQALKLWAKGLPVVQRPPTSIAPITIVGNNDARETTLRGEAA